MLDSFESFDRLVGYGRKTIVVAFVSIFALRVFIPA